MHLLPITVAACVAITVAAWTLPTPPGAHADHARLLIGPGFDVPPEDYLRVSTLIQQICLETYDIGVCIGTVDFPRMAFTGLVLGVPRTRAVRSAVRSAAARLDLGGPLVLVGHSVGALALVDPGQQEMAAIVLVGATLNGQGLAPWPSWPTPHVPYLQLLAEKDGYVRQTYAVVEDRDSVVVLPDVNHEQFAAGRPTASAEQTGRYDLRPAVGLAEAHRSYAAAVAAFVAATCGDARGHAALATLRASTGDHLTAFHDELHHEAVIAHAKRVQVIVSGHLLTEGQIAVEVFESDGTKFSVARKRTWSGPFNAFVYSKPSVNVADEGPKAVLRVNVTVYVDHDHRLRPTSGASAQVAPTVAVKCKSQDAITDALGLPRSAKNDGDVGRQVSEDSIGWARAPLRTAPDIDCPGGSSEETWRGRAPAIADGTVAAPKLSTSADLDREYQRFAGMTYITPLTRPQALEYVLYDAPKIADKPVVRPLLRSRGPIESLRAIIEKPRLAAGSLRWAHLWRSTVPSASASLESTAATVVQVVGRFSSFAPRFGKHDDIAVLLFPGARCDPTAVSRRADSLCRRPALLTHSLPQYAPLAAAISTRLGAPVVVAGGPGGWPDIDPLGAVAIARGAFPAATRWVYAGHSLGACGAIAACNEDAQAAALVMLGSTGWSRQSRAHMPLTESVPTLLVRGSLDKLVDLERLTAANLPPFVKVVEVEGTGHETGALYGAGTMEDVERVADLVAGFV